MIYSVSLETDPNMKTLASNRDNVEFYDRFAEPYERIYSCVDAEEAVRQWRMILDACSDGRPHGIDLVDIGCGPGWHLSAWAKAGFNVSGVDSSHRMLTAAKRNFSIDPGGKCDLYWRDVRELAMASETDSMSVTPKPSSFDLAVTHFNFLNLFAPSELQYVFAGVASLVRPGGVWLADCSVPGSPPPPVSEEYQFEAGDTLSCTGSWNVEAQAFQQTWRGQNLDIIEAFWFHSVQRYQQCALSSGWRTERLCEWRPDLSHDCWRELHSGAERLLLIFRRG